MKGAFPSRRATARQVLVSGVEGLANDVVLCLAQEESLRQAGLAIEHRAEGQQLAGNLTLHLVCPAGIPDPKIAPDPSNVPHCCVDALDVELVFQADGKAVEWTEDGFLVSEVGVEGPGALDGLVEEDLVETIVLFTARALVPLPCRARADRDSAPRQAYNLVGDGRRLAKGRRHLDCRELPMADAVDNIDALHRNNGYLVGEEKALDERPSKVALLSRSLQVSVAEPPFRADLRKRVGSLLRGLSLPGHDPGTWRHW